MIDMRALKQYKSIGYATAKCNAYHGCLQPKLGFRDCAVGKRCWFYCRARMLGGNPAVLGYDPADPWKPTFEPEKLDVLYKWKQPQLIAMSFMGDIAYAKVEWMKHIFKALEDNPRHWGYFLTKQPAELTKFGKFPDNCHVGVSVNYNCETKRITELVDMVMAEHKVVSFEPMYGAIYPNLTGIEWVWIGAQTQPDRQPKFNDLLYLVNRSKTQGASVFIKNNIWLPEGMEREQEYPETVLKKFQWRK